jgi:hypothetical protein
MVVLCWEVAMFGCNVEMEEEEEHQKGRPHIRVNSLIERKWPSSDWELR